MTAALAAMNAEAFVIGITAALDADYLIFQKELIAPTPVCLANAYGSSGCGDRVSRRFLSRLERASTQRIQSGGSRWRDSRAVGTQRFGQDHIAQAGEPAALANFRRRARQRPAKSGWGRYRIAPKQRVRHSRCRAFSSFHGGTKHRVGPQD